MAIETRNLGERHQKILNFIQDYQRQYARPPSIREIGDNCNISSVSVVNYYLDQLERSGYIERERRPIRGLQLSRNRMPEKRLLKVFLCHTSSDKQIVHDLYKRLLFDGVDAWLDKEKILPGQNWELEIRNALFDADVIIVCLSKNSVSRDGYVQKEIKYALDKSDEKPEEAIYIIPARLEECDVPLRLRKWQWVDLFIDDGYSKLISSLKRRSESLK